MDLLVIFAASVAVVLMWACLMRRNPVLQEMAVRLGLFAAFVAGCLCLIAAYAGDSPPQELTPFEVRCPHCSARVHLRQPVASPAAMLHVHRPAPVAAEQFQPVIPYID